MTLIVPFILSLFEFKEMMILRQCCFDAYILLTHHTTLSHYYVCAPINHSSMEKSRFIKKSIEIVRGAHPSCTGMTTLELGRTSSITPQDGLNSIEGLKKLTI